MIITTGQPPDHGPDSPLTEHLANALYLKWGDTWHDPLRYEELITDVVHALRTYPHTPKEPTP